ncbi:hypothetical protein IQ06DRAFT_330071 [Phaeosphaeriaceae sp. SRC1lsM3a]|nr:hypothetical protein IQ06DRAFT_330071 [Stagonospora sp. SRC1lsM3a]
MATPHLSLPPEIILKIIQWLPFQNGKEIASLKRVPYLKHLIEAYEHSITHWFMSRELRHAPVDFPYCQKLSLNWLAECVSSYDMIDAIMLELTWRENCVAIEPHNTAAANAGLLLLYRMGRIPLDPLVAIYIVLHHATLTARYHGQGWITQRTYGRFMDSNQLSLRNELEFCFAEATLSTGPEFLHDMLVNPCDPAGESTLMNHYLDHGTHDWSHPCWGDEMGEFQPPRTQGPQREEGMKPKTLFTTLLERMAELEGCELEDVRGRVEVRIDTHDHALAYLRLDGKERLLQGLDLEG